MEAESVGVRGEAGSLLGAIAACWEPEAEADNTGQDEKGRSCRQVEGAASGSAVSHRGEEEGEGGRTEERSPLDSGCLVCKRTPLNRTEGLVDEKLGTLGVVGCCVSREEEGWGVEEVSAWTSGRPPGAADTPPSVVASSSMARAKPWSTSAWMTDDEDVELGRDAIAVVVLLCEETLLPLFVFVLVNVGAVVLTPPLAFSEECFGMSPKTLFVFESTYKGGMEVETVVEVGALPLKSEPPLISGGRETSAGSVEVLRCAVVSEGFNTSSN